VNALCGLVFRSPEAHPPGQNPLLMFSFEINAPVCPGVIFSINKLENLILT